MKVPDLIELRVVAAGRPVPDAWIELTFPMPRKNAFHSCHGPSDVEGRIVVVREQVVRWARLQREFAIMDYEDLEGSWHGTFRARVMNGADLERAAAAARRFGEFVSYPEGYVANLEAARRSWNATSPSGVELRLAAPLQPGVTAELEPMAPTP